MPLSFSTKAGTLAVLNDKLSHAQVPLSVFFQVSEWEEDRKGCLERIGREFQGDARRAAPSDTSRDSQFESASQVKWYLLFTRLILALTMGCSFARVVVVIAGRR